MIQNKRKHYNGRNRGFATCRTEVVELWSRWIFCNAFQLINCLMFLSTLTKMTQPCVMELLTNVTLTSHSFRSTTFIIHCIYNFLHKTQIINVKRCLTTKPNTIITVYVKLKTRINSFYRNFFSDGARLITSQMSRG